MREYGVRTCDLVQNRLRLAALDTGYYMVVVPNDVGELKIMEEYSETQPQSDC